jgi:hypothetical protein
MKNPCYKCEKKQPPDCHVWCEEYIKWNADQKAEKTRIWKAKQTDKAYNNFKIENTKKAIRKKR